VLSFGDPFVSVVFSSWFVVQILFEVDTLSEVWCVTELMLYHWFMDVYVIGGTDTQLFIEQRQHGHG
jgi:hypothetical protein